MDEQEHEPTNQEVDEENREESPGEASNGDTTPSPDEKAGG